MSNYSIVVEDLGMVGVDRVRWEVRGRSGTLLAAGVVNVDEYHGDRPKQVDAAFEWAWQQAQQRRRELLAEDEVQ